MNKYSYYVFLDSTESRDTKFTIEDPVFKKLTEKDDFDSYMFFLHIGSRIALGGKLKNWVYLDKKMLRELSSEELIKRELQAIITSVSLN